MREAAKSSSGAGGRPAEPKAAPLRQTLLRGLRLLLVEDDDASRTVLRKILERFGAAVTAVRSGAEAIDACSSEAPDVIVSDIAMPEMDGYELIRTLRRGATTAATPAIALTAYARTVDRDHALASGFNEHVSKPVEPDRLASIIRRAADARPLQAARVL